jgi:hypothetical protein
MTTTITEWSNLDITHAQLRGMDDFDIEEITFDIHWSITIDQSDSSFNLVINIERFALDVSIYDIGFGKWKTINEIVTSNDMRDWNVEVDDMEIKSSYEVAINNVEIDFEKQSIIIEN